MKTEKCCKLAFVAATRRDICAMLVEGTMPDVFWKHRCERDDLEKIPVETLQQWVFSNYKKHRLNGSEEQDAPSGQPIPPYDKKRDFEWISGKVGRFRADYVYGEKCADRIWRYIVHYNPAPDVIQWCEEMDRNYILRLEREGKLFATEPHADTEIVPTHAFRDEIIAAMQRARLVAEAQAEAERKAKAEVERKAELERKVRAEADRKAKEEEERKAKAEADRKAKEEAERKTKAEAERKTKAEAERKAQAEATRKMREEAEKQSAREEALRKAREEAARRAKEEAVRKERRDERKAKKKSYARARGSAQGEIGGRAESKRSRNCAQGGNSSGTESKGSIRG